MAGLWADGVVDGNAGCDVQGIVLGHSHVPDGRGHWGNWPCFEQPQLISLLEHGPVSGWHATGRYAQCQTLTMKLDDQLHGPSRCDRIGVPA
jgi:hypothetical protein